jgi:two-component system, NtrC family, sensor kinase
MFAVRVNLRIKFIAGLVLFALALGICISIIMYFHFNSIMKSEISQRSRMLLAQSNAVQDYVKTQLRPEMFDTLPKGRFVLKAMSSSYISREVMSRLGLEDDLTYHYRRVSKNPRNPESAADTMEAGLITFFNENKGVTIWENDAMVKGAEYHIVARPVVFKESCMNCHGDPEDAPVELVKIYGSSNGFYHSVGEVGGVVVAGFPVDFIKKPVRKVTFEYLTYYLLGIVLFAVLISLFFDRLVMKNLHNLGTIFKTRFSGEREQTIIERLGEKDEIEGLIEGVDELAVCLADARNDLEDYAENLERKVEERTIEINEKAVKYRSDVRLFVEILSRSGEAGDTRQVIGAALESIGLRFDAAQVVYHCTVASEKNYAWHEEENTAVLEPNIREILWKDDILTRGSQTFIPVKSKESHWGILSLTWRKKPDRDDLNPAMLIALGQQLAILMENVQAFSDVRFQNAMLQSVFEGISDPLLLIDSDCRILMANKGSSKILHQRKKREREKELRSFLMVEHKNERQITILDVMNKKGRPITEEIETEDSRFFRVYLYPLPKRGKSGLRIVLYAREITLEKQMMSRMQQAERLGSIGQMAAGIAHEINNPLGVISCYTDLVKDAVTSLETLEDLSVIEKHTKNVQKIIRDLLKLSRQKQVVSGRCKVNKVVTDALKIFQTQAASKGIDVTTDLAEEMPAIKCDASILEQILTNMWINAFDALQETGGKVEIITRLAASSTEVILSMKDNGPGIPDHILENIFDPFFTTKEIGKGTGLGLAVIFGFVNDIGGKIEVSSDEFTRFDIYFPVERTL